MDAINLIDGKRQPVAFASDHHLWVLADEVYEDYVYAGVHTWARAQMVRAALRRTSCISR